ncbi:hypothetical protein [Propionimicrobium lymphophilum]|uniref:hypothetical protein n=1 Tax=Propionimicrobium lymphophilum TaxID=33012 RepID=UPI003EC514E7
MMPAVSGDVVVRPGRSPLVVDLIASGRLAAWLLKVGCWPGYLRSPDGLAASGRLLAWVGLSSESPCLRSALIACDDSEAETRCQ